MQKINIPTPSKPHECYLGNGILNELPQLLSTHKLPTTRFVIIDSRVADYWLKDLKSILAKIEGNTHYYIMPAGEKSKSFKSVQKILETMIELKINKDAVVIAVDFASAEAGHHPLRRDLRPSPVWLQGCDAGCLASFLSGQLYQAVSRPDGVIQDE